MIYLQYRWQISPALEMEGTDKEGRVDYTDKSDPIREQDCIWCMACVAVCPPQAIKVDQSNMEYHQVADQTFREVTP